MTRKEFRFTVEIAGIPAEICCQHEKNSIFFTDYLSDRVPLFTIDPSQEDLDRMRQTMSNTAEPENLGCSGPSPRFLENNTIHELLVEKLIEYDILLMHGSALAYDGAACIFTAPSGTGKSTHSRLWRESFGKRVIMINDDKPLLRFTEDGVDVYGSPWDGKHHLSNNCSAPLKAIVELSRSPANHIEPLEKANGFEVLMKQIYMPMDPAKKVRTIALMKKLLNNADVSFYHLGCTMEPETAVFVRDRIFGGDPD